jgi:hypothetical protein
MADKKSDTPVENDADNLIVKKVDKMMSIRGETPDQAGAGGISEVAASVNESLVQDLGTGKTPLPEMISAQTAPELPGEKKTAASEPEPKPEPEIAPESASEAVAEPAPIAEPKLDDSVTEKAVDAIVAEESDTVLAVEDAKTKYEAKAIVSKVSWREKIRGLFAHRRFWAVTVVILLIILALPVTRYKVLGLVIKKTVTISVVDSKTSNPVSNADVELGGNTAKTDANGKAKLSAGLGKRDLLVSKRYYKNLESSYFVGFKASKAAPIKIVATGRLVPVTVVNKITGKPIAGVQVQSEQTTAKTNSKGQADIALPTKAPTYTGKLVLKGYNPTDVTIQVTDKAVKANIFEITPAGLVYFLSNRSGTLDVVKSNLDGTDRKTILAGTGKEDQKATSLLASRDWRFLALKSHREGDKAALYLIDTNTDKVTQFDNGDAEFNLVGWYDHSFIYSLSRNNLSIWQAGQQALKSYDADHLQLNQLDQNQAEGAAGNYAYQNFSSFYILNNVIVYATSWNGFTGNATPYDLSGKNDTIRGIQPNGQNKKDYQTFSTTDNNFIQATPYEPQGVYFAVYDKSAKPTFYQFENQAVKTASIDQATFDKSYPTFLLSPSGSKTFWTELRDGKNALFTGDANAGSKKQVASLSEYSPYGWHSDAYMLVSKSSSELYVTSTEALASGRSPLKITDYYKPAQNFAGYGYGYGGL